MAHARGRVLAGEVTAPVDLPPFDRAAGDGLAVRADETVGASVYNPLSFRRVDARDDLPPGAGALVHAGERLPRGADAVVALDQFANGGDGSCSIVEPAIPGGGVERAGSQAVRGSRLAPVGRKLRPADIGFLTSAGISQVPVVRRPRVCCVLAGRNLVEAGSSLPHGAVHDGNGPLIASLVARDGGVLIAQRSVGRSIAAIREALTASDADVFLVAGSSGTGPGDHAAAALAGAGSVAIHGVALRPGETAGMGRAVSGALVFLLPGAPAACLWAYELLAGRGIRRLGGLNPPLPFRSRTMTAGRKIVSEIGMTEVCPVRHVGEDRIQPMASFAEAGLAAATLADGFVLVPEGSEGYAQGASVSVYLYDERGSHDATSPARKP